MTNNPNLIQIIEKLGSQIEEIKGSRDYLNERLEKIGETYKKLNVVLKERTSFSQVETIVQNLISIILPNEARTDEPSWKRYGLIPIPMEHRAFFPGYRVPFILVTDIGEIETYVTSAAEGTRSGNRKEGKYIAKGIKAWYRKHPRLKSGDEVRFSQLESHRRYQTRIIHN